MIPKRKHSDKELSELRARSAMQSSNSPIAALYQKKLANKGMVVLGYILPLTSPILGTVKLMNKDANYSMGFFYAMAIPIVLAMIIALWIALRCVLSRHNAAFIFIISLFCCFPIVNAVNSDKDLQYELLSLIDKESALPESESSLDAEASSGNMSAYEVRELLRLEEERIQKENRERLLEAETTPSAPESSDE